MQNFEEKAKADAGVEGFILRVQCGIRHGHMEAIGEYLYLSEEVKAELRTVYEQACGLADVLARLGERETEKEPEEKDVARVEKHP